MAASFFCFEGIYSLKKRGLRRLSQRGMTEQVWKWVDRYLCVIL